MSETNLAVGVRLKADASQFIAPTKAASAELARLTETSNTAAQAARILGGGSGAAATSARTLAREVAQVDGGMRQAAAASTLLAGQQQQVSTMLGGAASASDKAAQSSRTLTEQQKRATEVTGLQRAGYMQLGAQLQDIVAQASTGTSIFTILAQQGGQIAAALAMIAPQASTAVPAMDQVAEGAGEIGQAAVDSAEKFTDFRGALGRAATFMAGPWGAIVLAAASVLGKFAWEAYNAEESLDELTTSLDQATKAADTWGAAQSLLSQAMDLGTQAITTQNTALREHIRLQAEAGILEAETAKAKAREELAEVGDPSLTEAVSLGFRGVGKYFGSPGTRPGQVARDYNLRQAPLRSLVQEVLAGGMDATTIRGRVDWLQKTGNLSDYDDAGILDLKRKLYKIPVAEDKATAFQAAKDALDGNGFDNRLKPYERGRKPRNAKEKSPESRDEFGRDAAARIAGMVAEFDGTPEVIENINGKVAQLDDLIEDIGRRKPPGFKDLIASAEAAKTVVRDGLIQSVTDAFKAPEELGDRAAQAIGDLDSVIADLSARKPIDWEKSVAGAQAAKSVIAEALNRPLDEYLRQQDEAAQIQQLLISGRADEAEALQVVLDLQRKNITVSDGQKQTILDTVRARRAEAAELERVRRIQGQYLDAARDTAAILHDATDAFVRGDLFVFLQTPAKLVDAVQQMQERKLFEGLFGEAFAELERELTDGPVEKSARRMAGGMDTATAAVKRLGDAATGAASEIATGEAAAITVNGKLPDTAFDPRDPIERALAKAAASIADLFTSPELAKQIGDNIGAAGAAALKGAATGRAISTVAVQLGFGHIINGTGTQLGGAAGGLMNSVFGQALGAFGPVAGIIGSIAGGLIGSMFEGPTRSGYSSIGTDANGNAVSAISGGRNSEGRQRESLTYADAVLDGLSKIAGGLGGRLGSGLDLGTIGTQGDKYVFDPDGAGTVAGSKFDSLDKAIEAALASAVGKGAVTGLSDAVRKALGSSSDLDKALSEALQVKQLETLLGGVAGQMSAMFAEFDNTAAERVRLARSYGLDLLAVEKKNAEERAALLDDALKSRVGSLQSLLDDMRFGSLFEGDGVARRTQILSEIEDAKADADAGVAGAADRVAELYRLLLDTTRENFGTAGDQLTGDRALVQSGAADIIKRETDRINAAAQQAKATTDAVVAGNALADEGNDIAATNNAKLSEISAQLAALTAAVQLQTASTERARYMQSTVRPAQLT